VQKLLPEVFESAYDDNPDAKTTPITLWGVIIDPNGAKDAKASVILMKWLRARHASFFSDERPPVLILLVTGTSTQPRPRR